MDIKATIILIVILFAAAFGWQMALYVPPSEYRFAGWIVCGVGTIVTAMAAMR